MREKILQYWEQLAKKRRLKASPPSEDSGSGTLTSVIKADQKKDGQQRSRCGVRKAKENIPDAPPFVKKEPNVVTSIITSAKRWIEDRKMATFVAVDSAPTHQREFRGTQSDLPPSAIKHK